MKKRQYWITAALLALALVCGVLLPRLFVMSEADREPTQYELNAVSLNSAYSIGEKLQLLNEVSFAVDLPSGENLSNEQVTNRTRDFIDGFFPEHETLITNMAAGRLILQDGGSFVVWNCELALADGSGNAVLVIDDETGALLACGVHVGYFTLLSEKISSLKAVREQFAQTLSQMLPVDEISWEAVSPQEELSPGETTVNIRDGEEQYEIFFYLDESTLTFNLPL